MVIDKFLTWFMRKKASSYLTFNNLGDIEPPQAPTKPIYLYIHIPFCSELCPYCSFHRVRYSDDKAKIYFTALKKELLMYRDRGFRFSNVYIGGGTPTISLKELYETLALLQELFSPEEISVETNPDRLDRDILSELAGLGVKRVSVGIQSFADEILRAIGRLEKYGSRQRLMDKLQGAKGYVDTLNVDMIFNFPIQDRDMLESDLDDLYEISPDQITFYPLMVSNATRKKMKTLMGSVDLQKERLFYEIINSRLADTYKPGSAWCFSRKDSKMIDEYIVSGSDYVGAGSGAFGLVNGAIYANTFSLNEYAVDIDQGRFPLYAKKGFSSREMARYSFLMDLFGLYLDRDRFRRRFKRDILYMLGPECLFFYLAGGLSIDADSIRLTQRGRYYWVVMMREFFIGVDNFRDISRGAAGITL